MFSPWLIPYYTQNMQNTPANWIRQVIANTPILLPWSETYAPHAQQIFHSFIDCIHFFLETFPACDMIMGNILAWYEVHFGNVAVPRHIFTPTNSSLMLLPWNRLKPTPLNIHGFYRLLQQVNYQKTPLHLRLSIDSYLCFLVSARLSHIHRFHFSTNIMDTMGALQHAYMGLLNTSSGAIHIANYVCEVIV